MKDFLLKILGSLVRSIVVSVILFVAGVSLVTGEFPPDFSKIKNSLQQVQQMTTVSRQIMGAQKSLKAQQNSQGYVEDEDLQKLQELQLKRAEIGAAIMAGAPVDEAGAPTERTTTPSEDLKEIIARLNRLEDRMLKIENKVFTDSPNAGENTISQ